MPRLNILSFSEQKEFDTPKELTGDERKVYFRKNAVIDNLLISINSSVNKVAFSLMLYHFKISKKFFQVKVFSNKDVKYISHIFDFNYISDHQCFLENKTFNRYKNQILEHTGYTSFNQEANELIGAKAYNLAIQYIRPKVIFNDCIKLLLEQRIEIPKYHAILLIISNVLQQYKNSLLQILNEHLSIETKGFCRKFLSELNNFKNMCIR